MGNVNEKPWFKSILHIIGNILHGKYISYGFRKITTEEFIDRLKSIPKKCKRAFIKFFEGYGYTLVHDGEDEYGIKVMAHTSWIWYKNLFKIHANAWNLLFHPDGPLDPLFRPPKRRTKDFLKNFPEESRICRDAARHWRECESCNRKLFWRPIQAKSFEEAYIHFDNRALYCSNKECGEYGKETGLTLLDIVLPSEKDTKIFIEPIVRAYKRRKKDFERLTPEELPRPNQLLRYLTKLGYVFHRKPGVYANDTAKEKELNKLKIPPYTDLRYEHLSGYYPNG